MVFASACLLIPKIAVAMFISLEEPDCLANLKDSWGEANLTTR